MPSMSTQVPESAFQDHAALPADEIWGAAQVRAQHSAMLLRLLWQIREISRADLARKTGLSRSTISAIVSDLLDTGLIHEARPGESRGGRKPILLAFNDDAYFLVGVDMGATHVSVLITNLRAETRYWASKSYVVRDNPRGAQTLIAQMVNDAVTEAELKPSQILGMGVASPSPIDPKQPGFMHPMLMPKWKGYDMQEAFHQAFVWPVFIDNDANLGALAELWWGTRQKGRGLVFVKVATGVGAGLIINGRVHRGRSGTAGEVGHISLDPSGPRCVCGLNGCINTLIGSKNLLDRVKSQFEVYPDSRLVGRRRLNIDRVVDAALEGDPLAVEVVAYAGRTLGIGVAYLLNLLAPDAVVIGGGITRAGACFIDPLKATISGISLTPSMIQTEIELSQLGERGIALGALTMVLEAALDTPTMFQNRR